MTAESHPPRELLSTDDRDGAAFEHEAEVRRQDAYAAVYEWRGAELRPWSIGREQLYFRLRAADASLPLAVALQHPETFLGDAVKILYLCHHEPAEWRYLRSDVAAFLEAIEAWAEQHIPRHLQSDAMELGMRILNDSASTRAVPRPSSRQGGEDPGN